MEANTVLILPERGKAAISPDFSQSFVDGSKNQRVCLGDPTASPLRFRTGKEEMGVAKRTKRILFLLAVGYEI
ncbi:hypothetical protein GW17_00033704 [Ensete ventricosum]|nr:hypothetical protein GW17_00033704 [Ensete ventricosum]